MSFFAADEEFRRFEDITPEKLKKSGVELLLCDLDNTLTERLSKFPAENLRHWLKDLNEAGVEVVVISNNVSKKRVQKFCEPFGIECVWGAKKPLSIKLTKVRVKKGVPPAKTVMLGDKISTDVLAAHFAGIRAWKVEHRKKVMKNEK